MIYLNPLSTAIVGMVDYEQFTLCFVVVDAERVKCNESWEISHFKWFDYEGVDLLVSVVDGVDVAIRS